MTTNPVAVPNTLFTKSEDLSSPRFQGLREQYGLDDIVAGESDEFRRIRLLRHWLHEHVKVDKSKPADGKDALEMLAAAPGGGAYSCGHMMTMQNAVLNVMGHVARCVFSGAGTRENRLSGSHGMNEVWVNDLQKWVIVDAEHDAHFEKDGVPLSAVEIRHEVWKNDAVDVFRTDGPDRVKQPRERDDSWGRTPRTYAFISWYPEADYHTRFPKKRSSKEIVVADDIWRENTWYRGDRKHFAYDAELFVEVADPAAVYWTPNVVNIEVDVEGNSAAVTIASETPNLKEYQIREPEGDWRATPDKLSLDLRNGSGEWHLRSVNSAGVTGPVYRLVIGQ